MLKHTRWVLVAMLAGGCFAAGGCATLPAGSGSKTPVMEAARAYGDAVNRRDAEAVLAMLDGEAVGPNGSPLTAMHVTQMLRNGAVTPQVVSSDFLGSDGERAVVRVVLRSEPASPRHPVLEEEHLQVYRSGPDGWRLWRVFSLQKRVIPARPSGAGKP